MGYLIYGKSVYDGSQGKIVITNNKDFNNFQYGVYLSSGYNSINVYAYYGLNSLFQSAKTTTESIDMNSLNVGIIFYQSVRNPEPSWCAAVINPKAFARQKPIGQMQTWLMKVSHKYLTLRSEMESIQISTMHWQ
jgi:hypothetical protein